MNWKRGLVRMWIVFAGVWFTLAALFYYGSFTRLEEVERPYTSAECERLLPEHPCPPPHIAVLEYERVWLAPSWQFLTVTVAGPLLLFGIGAAGYWVAAGFKRDGHARRSHELDVRTKRQAGAG